MSFGHKHAYDTHFGPPSALINVSGFLQSARDLQEALDLQQSRCGEPSMSAPALRGTAYQTWIDTPSNKREEIEAECRVDDIRSSVKNAISDPRTMGLTMKTHEATVRSLYEAANSTAKKKRKRVVIPEPAQEPPSAVALRTQLEAVKLKSWPLTLTSALFIRPPKQSDHNCLISTKSFANPSNSHETREALLFITIYNPLSWGHKLIARSSQHVLSSSQTLGDMFDIIPCVFNELSEPSPGNQGKPIWQDDQKGETSAFACLEGVVYGDGLSEEDYSETLFKYFEDHPVKNHSKLTKGTSMYDTQFRSLSLRLHTPYHILHAGDCQHFFVVEEIRLHHLTDPPLQSFPLTTQITPPILDLCRACGKVPAVWSIVGDIRLGESPFVMCDPCWKWMGMPRNKEVDEVKVVPLPRYEHGWAG